MPDITMCNGFHCPKKEKCYRYRATPNSYRQSYFIAAPVKGDGECEYFSQLRDDEVKPCA
jgi:hypothetical protein